MTTSRRVARTVREPLVLYNPGMPLVYSRMLKTARQAFGIWYTECDAQSDNVSCEQCGCKTVVLFLCDFRDCFSHSKCPAKRTNCPPTALQPPSNSPRLRSVSLHRNYCFSRCRRVLACCRKRCCRRFLCKSPVAGLFQESDNRPVQALSEVLA